MGENSSEFTILGRASESQLFHLQNGLDLQSVRDLALTLKTIPKDVFDHHVNIERNDFATWVRDVFGDDELASELEAAVTKEEMAQIIEDRLIDLEEQELERFGLHIPNTSIKSLEDYIETKKEQGLSDEDVRKRLLKKGWKHNIVDLILEGLRNPFDKYINVHTLEDVETFHTKLEKLKKHIINTIANGGTIEDIKQFLNNQGWHQDIIDFIFYDVFKPHPNIKKLSHYIVHQVKNKHKDIQTVKNELIKLGWKDYLIDSVIFGMQEPKRALQKILAYLEEFTPDNHSSIKAFLLKMGWDEIQVNDALQEREIDAISTSLQKQYNIKDGAVLKEHSHSISPSIVELDDIKEVNEVIKQMKKDFKKKDIMKFKNQDGELHLNEEYTYYYDRADIIKIKNLSGKHVYDAYYKEENKPLLIDQKKKYLVLPKIIKRECAVTKKLLPLNKLKAIEMWDETRTHKITKYVSLEHEKDFKNFLEETRIVQN